MATWTSLTYAFGSTLTSTKMTQNQDNFTALANGDTGAPKIQTAALDTNVVTNAKMADDSVNTAEIVALAVTTAKLAASAVTWGKISTSLQQSSGLINDAATAIISFTGANQTLGWAVDTGFQTFVTPSNDNAFAWKIGIMNNSGGSTTYRFQASYINSSPPWDLGDGEFDTPFIYLEMNGNSVVRVDISESPPWAYRGPTSIIPAIEENNKKYRRVKALIAEHGSIRAARLAGLTWESIISRLETDNEVMQEITQELKNADMNLFPHPFSPTGNRVVLLDPLAPVMERLKKLHRMPSDDTRLSDMFMGNVFKIDELTGRAAPSGVVLARVAFR